MEEEQQFVIKIKTLIDNANQIKPNELDNNLEILVKEAMEDEEEIEQLLIQYLSDIQLQPEIRQTIIRIAGKTQQSLFLVPLKKIIDTDPHSRIRMEAIMAVGHFNDRRALNILTQALQRNSNPLLKRAINEEISRIKENNPILALLPRFQEGQKNPKTFKNTLQILKNILTPTDTTIFTKFLSSNDPLIKNGAFEILCITGDIFHDSEILEFYKTHFNQIECLNDKECEKLYLLVYHIKIYLSRYQFLIEEQIPLLKDQLVSIKDLRAKQILLSLICKSKEKDSINFIANIYLQEESLDIKISIIKDLSGNDSAIDFLFEKYRTEVENPELKAVIIESLLNSQQGLDYFIQHFFKLSFEDQELIVKKLPYASQHDLVEFIKTIFQADMYRLKKLLLSKINLMYEFSIQDLLFAPDSEREFHFMGDDYFNTITRLFPVTSVKKLLTNIASPNISVSKAKKYLLKIAEVVPHELIFNFKDKDFITKLFNKILKSNNVEMNVSFLGILKYIKTLDVETYKIFREAINLFITQRESKITPAEKGELTRIKRSFKDIFYEIDSIEKGTVVLNRFLKKKTIDFDILRELLIRYHLTIIKHKDVFINFLVKNILRTTHETFEEWKNFLSEFPRMIQIIQPILEDKEDQAKGVLAKGLIQFIKSFDPEPPRIVLYFKKRKLTAILREEFQEILPDFSLALEDKQLKSTDILLCDSETLRDLILQTRQLPEKIYLFLDQSSGYSEFKSYNTNNFVQPFLFYRIIKEIMKKLYL